LALGLKRQESTPKTARSSNASARPLPL
jgi:hypothetical protein